jgi:hypothetical protein
VQGEVEIAVRPEDIRLLDGGPTAYVKQRIPRGHYQEVVMTAPYGDLRAFVSNDAEVAEQVGYAFSRALIYQDNRLVQNTDHREK